MTNAKSLKKCMVAVCVATATILSGCASVPLKVDVGTPASRVSIGERPKISKVEIINKAPDPLFENLVFSAVPIPIKFDPSTKNTVVADLRNYFDSRTVVSPDSPTSISVTISKAEAYWVLSMADKTPFLGLARAGADKDFYLDIQLQIEVEKDGKVQSSYAIKDRIITEGSAAFMSDIVASYKKLIEKYRDTVLSELDDRFIKRYL